MGDDKPADGIDGAAQADACYRSLVERLPDGIWVHDGTAVVYANPATLRLLAADSADQVVGRPLTDFVHPTSISALLDRARTLTLAGPAGAPAETTLLRLDGVGISVETVSVLTTWHGHPAYQVVIHDLTAQHHAEAARRRAEHYFTTVVSQLEEGVVVIDPEGRIEAMNPAAERIFGTERSDEQVIGHTIQSLPLVLLDANAQPLPPSRHPIARTLATGETITGYVFGVDRDDGQRRWLSGSSRLLNPDDARSSAVSSFADITEFRASRRQLEYQATHDSLTGLGNRSLILSRLATALASTAEEQPVSTVLFIDLDGFKAINDTLGHAIGDTVLQIVAQRLQRALRSDDIVGRLGGDEFLVLLFGITRPQDTEALVARLRKTTAEPIVARGHRIEVNASIGVTELRSCDPRTPEGVLHDADLAMYRAKPARRHQGTITPGRPGTSQVS
ncbi:diguanylate cyclase domain-containing protein [Nocardia sp. CNY236]|uniref:diguanylate cyclase domain-containing protein n=1 Tax=Nocardia sp. CNY236 TaxID=1169152 RepID=UPI00048D19DC|nr:diguanylate cyclase [Nocardia sp. CNY236]